MTELIEDKLSGRVHVWQVMSHVQVLECWERDADIEYSLNTT